MSIEDQKKLIIEHFNKKGVEIDISFKKIPPGWFINRFNNEWINGQFDIVPIIEIDLDGDEDINKQIKDHQYKFNLKEIAEECSEFLNPYNKRIIIKEKNV